MMVLMLLHCGESMDNAWQGHHCLAKPIEATLYKAKPIKLKLLDVPRGRPRSRSKANSRLLLLLHGVSGLLLLIG
jgi:hypothetical protein